MPTWRTKNVQMLVEIELEKNMSVRTLVEGYENQRVIRQQQGQVGCLPPMTQSATGNVAVSLPPS